ncbi:helix-turn-helix transcriptional regulator [Halobacillus sp. Marseille-Q1614]|uniref:helix-turn-helix transcriptional regulator n=1 Tax=Halobacillus sp. Marseille-Q1614 TaxID=2709134 RepID=UPI00156E5A11|nr:helix-turn-helix transcriptional regulator [Halobacillus sp. Marseille-Q1614]
MYLSNRVKELRAKIGWTQTDLARQVEVSRQTIAALEKDDYIPSLLLAMRVAQAFDLQVEEIFTLEDER